MNIFSYLLAGAVFGCSLQADNAQPKNEYDMLDLNLVVEEAQPNPTPELTLEQLFYKGNDALTTGKVDEAIDYFTQAVKEKKSSPQLLFNLGIAYERKGDLDHATEAYNNAILLRPDYVKAHLQRAALLQRKGNIEEALVHYQHATRLDHNLIDTHITIARLLCDQERFAEALPYFDRATKARPDHVQLKFEYANTLTICNHNEQAIVLYKELLKVRPNDVAILYNAAFTLKKLGRITEAMPYYQKALERNPQHTEAQFSLGLAYLTMGNFQQGWPLYEYRWKRNAQLSERTFAKPSWDGSPLDGKTVLIHAEQGLGDTFQFIRYVWEIKKQHRCIIICAVQRPIHTIISRCCPYIDRVVTLSDIPTSFDVHLPLMSLPLIFKTKVETIPHTIPYIFPDPALVKHWQQRLAQDTGVKVGICFQGNNKYSTAFLRATVAAKSIPVHEFAPLATLEGVSLYCLQKDTGIDQLKDLSPQFNLHIFDNTFDTTNGRFMDTAAIIKNLDLVITVDTSIAHLAAAVGTPTWIILPEPADWRWMLNRSDSPWYPHYVRLFRQSKSGDWDHVIQTVKNELHTFIVKKNNNSQHDEPAMSRTQSSSPRLSNALQELLKIKAQTMKTIDSNDTEAFINELRKAHHLHQLLKLIKKIEKES